MAQKAVITILGTIGGNAQKCEFNPNWEPAGYKSEIEEISECKDINSLPILIKTFEPLGYEVIALHTDCARKIQEGVVSNHQDELVKQYKFDKKWLIEDDKNYDRVFSQIDELINYYDKVIIDVSHGYRHLPILMIVNTIMHNIESIDKIEKIIFAKEEEFGKEYTFIDLKRYLDLANISYALTTFDRNYTVANNIKVSDNDLNAFLENLSIFSKHILANSIDGLLRDTNKKQSITTQLIKKIDKITKEGEEIFDNLKRLLDKTRTHLEETREISDKDDYEKHYLLSENMLKKGYLLNSITLLSEAIGMYCAGGLKNISSNVKNKIEEFEERALSEKNNENTPYKLYELYNQSKVFYKIYPTSYKGTYLKVSTKTNNKNNRTKLEKWNVDAEELTENIKETLLKPNEDIGDLARKIDDIRNNLAHANSSKRLEDVEQDIKDVLDRFKRLCIEQNILEVKSNKH